MEKLVLIYIRKYIVYFRKVSFLKVKGPEGMFLEMRGRRCWRRLHVVKKINFWRFSAVRRVEATVNGVDLSPLSCRE